MPGPNRRPVSPAERDHLISVGYGKTRLLNESDPFADANRRVQATNVTETKSASR